MKLKSPLVTAYETDWFDRILGTLTEGDLYLPRNVFQTTMGIDDIPVLAIGANIKEFEGRAAWFVRQLTPDTRLFMMVSGALVEANTQFSDLTDKRCESRGSFQVLPWNQQYHLVAEFICFEESFAYWVLVEDIELGHMMLHK